MAKITVEEIRARYPNPRAKGEIFRLGEYCVGGALMLWLCDQRGCYAPIGYSFPNGDRLSWTLRMLNPAIDYALACSFSCDLIHANDTGDFEKAWRLLGEALDYGQAPEQPEPVAEEEELACV